MATASTIVEEARLDHSLQSPLKELNLLGDLRTMFLAVQGFRGDVAVNLDLQGKPLTWVDNPVPGAWVFHLCPVVTTILNEYAQAKGLPTYDQEHFENTRIFIYRCMVAITWKIGQEFPKLKVGTSDLIVLPIFHRAYIMAEKGQLCHTRT
jgi:hypothetical protein